MKLLGTLRRLDDQHGAVRVGDVYATDVEDLWEPCTDTDRLARWIAEVSGDLVAGGTRLVVEERGVPLTQVASYGAGWQVHVEDLAAHVAGNDRDEDPSRWRAAMSAYQEVLGP